MNHIRQKPYECFPTVCAMLLDRRPSAIIRAILGEELKGQSWAYLIANSRSSRYALLEKRVRRFLARRLPWVPWEALGEPRCPTPAQKLPEGPGRWVAVVNRHVIAGENGIVYDPCRPLQTVEAYTMQLRATNAVIRLIAEEPRD